MMNILTNLGKEPVIVNQLAHEGILIKVAHDYIVTSKRFSTSSVSFEITLSLGYC